MENMIVKHGKEIQGVFVHWDNGATGVIQAAKAAGISDLFIVGVDGNRAGYVQVKNGEQSVSIAQDFVLMTKTDLGLARDVAGGQEGPAHQLGPAGRHRQGLGRDVRAAGVVGSA